MEVEQDQPTVTARRRQTDPLTGRRPRAGILPSQVILAIAAISSCQKLQPQLLVKRNSCRLSSTGIWVIFGHFIAWTAIGPNEKMPRQNARKMMQPAHSHHPPQKST